MRRRGRAQGPCRCRAPSPSALQAPGSASEGAAPEATPGAARSPSGSEGGVAEGRADARLADRRRGRVGSALLGLRRGPRVGRAGISVSAGARPRNQALRMPRRAGTVAGGRWARWVTAASSAGPLPRRNGPWVRVTMVRAVMAGLAAPSPGGSAGVARWAEIRSALRRAPGDNVRARSRRSEEPDARLRPRPCFARSSPRLPPSTTGVPSSSSTGRAARRCPSG